MERILSREPAAAEPYFAVEKLKVGVAGISETAGASFLTGCLARYLSNTKKHMPAVVELGSGSLFDSYGMDKRFAGRSYFHFYQTLEENKSIRGVRNMDEGINWILKTPQEDGIQLTCDQKLQLVSHAKGDIVLCDLSGSNKLEFPLLRNMDQIIAVIDPMPSKMLSGYGLLCNIKEYEANGGNVIYVVNKFNRGVNRRQMLDFLKLKNHIVLPLVPTETIYTAEYNCKIPYTLNEIKSLMQKPMEEIALALNF